MPILSPSPSLFWGD